MNDDTNYILSAMREIAPHAEKFSDCSNEEQSSILMRAATLKDKRHDTELRENSLVKASERAANEITDLAERLNVPRMMAQACRREIAAIIYRAVREASQL